MAGTGFKPRFVLATGRVPPEEPDPELLRIYLHGEYQLRATVLSDLPLAPFRGDPHHGIARSKLSVAHWFRLTPRVLFRDTLELVGQIDMPRGFFLGEKTVFVDSADEPLDDRNPFGADPRWLYLQYNSPIGLFRVGQQGAYWGLGILVNDGDHPTLFGDYVGGARVERILFATRPLGRDYRRSHSPPPATWCSRMRTPICVTTSSRSRACSRRIMPIARRNMLGFYAVYRHQTREAESLPAASSTKPWR